MLRTREYYGFFFVLLFLIFNLKDAAFLRPVCVYICKEITCEIIHLSLLHQSLILFLREENGDNTVLCFSDGFHLWLNDNHARLWMFICFFYVSPVVFLLAQTEMWLQFVDYVVDHLLKLQGPPTGCRDGWGATVCTGIHITFWFLLHPCSSTLHQTLLMVFCLKKKINVSLISHKWQWSKGRYYLYLDKIGIFLLLNFILILDGVIYLFIYFFWLYIQESCLCFSMVLCFSYVS